MYKHLRINFISRIKNRTDERRTSNIERPTSNKVWHRIYNKQMKSLCGAMWPHYSMFKFGRSMLDVYFFSIPSTNLNYPLNQLNKLNKSNKRFRPSQLNKLNKLN